MVGRGRTGYIREIVIAQCKFPCVGKVRGDVLRDELLAHRRALTCQPGIMAVIRILRRRVRRPWHHHPVGSGKSAEVIIEAMVLFDDEHDVLDWPNVPLRSLLPSLLHFTVSVGLGHVCTAFRLVGHSLLTVMVDSDPGGMATWQGFGKNNGHQ